MPRTKSKHKSSSGGRGKSRGKKTQGKHSGLPRTIERTKHQTGRVRNAYLDSKRKALPPGKRISRNKRVYYEYRANRSDLGKT